MARALIVLLVLSLLCISTYGDCSCTAEQPDDVTVTSFSPMNPSPLDWVHAILQPRDAQGNAINVRGARIACALVRLDTTVNPPERYVVNFANALDQADGTYFCDVRIPYDYPPIPLYLKPLLPPTDPYENVMLGPLTSLGTPGALPDVDASKPETSVLVEKTPSTTPLNGASSVYVKIQAATAKHEVQVASVPGEEWSAFAVRSLPLSRRIPMVWQDLGDGKHKFSFNATTSDNYLVTVSLKRYGVPVGNMTYQLPITVAGR